MDVEGRKGPRTENERGERLEMSESLVEEMALEERIW